MARRPLPDDFKEFIDFLNANSVKYLLVGGWAVGIHGYPRATKDIDFLIAVDRGNLQKLRKAFYQFGAPTIEMAHFKVPGNFFRMGRSPVQIDIITNAVGRRNAGPTSTAEQKSVKTTDRFMLFLTIGIKTVRF
jgi:hypothetical protein